MNYKIDITLNKTIKGPSRIERFLNNYGHSLNVDQVKKIVTKIQELENIAGKL
jgi:hypothetical protein